MLKRRLFDSIRRAAANQWVDRLASTVLPHRATVFMLHQLSVPDLGIDGHDPAFIAACLQRLRSRGFVLVPVDDLIQNFREGRQTSRPQVAFTLDDGFDAQVEVATEVFAHFDCPAAFFLITGFLDRQVWPWDHRLQYALAHTGRASLPLPAAIACGHSAVVPNDPQVPDQVLRRLKRLPSAECVAATAGLLHDLAVPLPDQPPPGWQSVSWERVRALERRGMRFGAHSVSHAVLARLSDSEVEREIRQSLDRVRSECASPLNLFVYPSGKLDEFDARAVGVLSDLRLDAAFSSEPGFVTRRALARPFELARMSFPNSKLEVDMAVSAAQFAREWAAALRAAR